jgi:hypothetical protein
VIVAGAVVPASLWQTAVSADGGASYMSMYDPAMHDLHHRSAGLLPLPSTAPCMSHWRSGRGRCTHAALTFRHHALHCASAPARGERLDA